MHGRGVEERRRVRHMLTVSTHSTTIVSADDFSSSSSSPDSFCKDGRKITVGECALFKPPHDEPPFIGIIRWFTVDKESKLKLGVNWLYRPSEVKLGKGILLEASPNEVFYSFHRDEILSASLLHPCKVAFLPKDIKPPSGILSLVCRRVYDITNKCLWWLTDKNYINELQEEVDQLLFKTQTEMQTTVHPDGRSPKRTLQLKAGPDSIQNTVCSQIKGKKRERVDQSSEPIKRKHIMKTEEGEHTHGILESFLKCEIAKFTEKGSLLDSKGVEKLIQLMLPEGSDKKIDLVSRSMLAAVIAATANVECLSQFVHLKGLPVFDEWLQEVHKGKFGDGCSPKECDKSVEEFLLILLCALDKLPINLLALQMCNIGKSVNYLRTHKNIEIQKKARSLVDTWKKHVEAEMSINDSKSGSNQSVPWTTKPRLSEASHGVATKSTVSQLSTSKAAMVKVVHDEVIFRSPSASPGSMKSVPSPTSVSIHSKDGLPRTPAVNNANELPQTVAMDEKSSISSQSYYNSQSCSSEHAKTEGMGKEDTRSSTAGSAAMSNAPGGSSRQWKSFIGFPGSAVSGAQRETISGRSSLVHKGTNSERISQSGTSSDKTPDVNFGEGHGRKFIVKITNHGRSTGVSANAGSVEDLSLLHNRTSSLGLSEKPHQATISSDVNMESWKSNDIKDVASNNVQGSLAVFNGEEGGVTTGDVKASKISYPSPGNENKIRNTLEPSLSSINALIDSCVKYSETNVSTSVGDDMGINLLANVAAGVISKSSFESPNNTPERNVAAVECSYLEYELKVKASNDCVDENKQNFDAKLASQDEEKPAVELNGVNSSVFTVQETTRTSLEANKKRTENFSAASPEISLEKSRDDDGAKPLTDKTTAGGLSGDTNLESKTPSGCSLTDEVKGNKTVSNLEVEGGVVEGSSLSHTLSKADGKDGGELIEENASAGKHSDSGEGANDEVQCTFGLAEALVTVSCSEINNQKNLENVAAFGFKQPDEQHTNGDANIAFETQDLARGPTATTHDVDHINKNLKSRCGDQNVGQVDLKVSLVFPVQDDQGLISRESKLSGIEEDESTSTILDASSISAAGVADNDTKVGFDLNEGFDVEGGKCEEPSNSTAPGSSAAVWLVSPIPFPISTVSSTIPSSITVASAAKGPFVSPEDLLRSKGELGWKGSATTTFPLAEPRKVSEIPCGSTISPVSEASPVGKHNRLLLDFDLNVLDERILEDMNPRNSAVVSTSNSRKNSNLGHDVDFKLFSSSGRCDLDLNQANEFPEVSNYSTNKDRRTDAAVSVNSPTNPLCNPVVAEGGVCRDFDLNGPFLDEAGAELSPFSQHAKSSVPSHVPVSGLWMNNTEMGNLSTRFPPRNTYPNFSVPLVMTEREEHPFPVATGGDQRILGPTGGGNTFSPNVYRGPVLSSSPAVPFTPAPFQYSLLSFGNNFPLASATYATGSTPYLDSPGGRFCFPAVHSQLLGPTGPVSTHYPRPYVISLSDGSNTSSPEAGKKWGRQSLDLNAGLGCPDTEGKDAALSLAPRQISVSSQLLQEDRVRMYQPASSVLKRKDPDGRWDDYKQSSWQ